MVILICIFVFIISCYVESISRERSYYNKCTKRRLDKLIESSRKSRSVSRRNPGRRVIRRRICKDSNGNTIAEEIIEEIIDLDESDY